MFHQPAPPSHPTGGQAPGGPGQDLLKGPFHTSLIVILEFVLIADQCEGVRDSKLRRQREKPWLVAVTAKWLGSGPCMAAEQWTWAGLSDRGHVLEAAHGVGKCTRNQYVKNGRFYIKPSFLPYGKKKICNTELAFLHGSSCPLRGGLSQALCPRLGKVPSEWATLLWGRLPTRAAPSPIPWASRPRRCERHFALGCLQHSCPRA